MTSQCRSEYHEIEIDILSYLLKHPDAQDTLEGIIQWWLLERYIRQKAALVSQALSELVNKGLIVESYHSSSPMRYQINKDNIQKIQDLIRSNT